MQVVIAGASGFLGRSLCKALAEQPCETLAVSREKNIGQTTPSLQVSDDYSETPSGDVLVYLAEPSNAVLAEKIGQKHVKTCLERLNNVIEKGFRHIIYFSSAMVYGDQTETSRTVRENVAAFNIYTEAKLKLEGLVAQQKGLIVRPANVYGPAMSSSNVLSRILEQIPGEGPVEVFDTAPVRDFIWHEDLAKAVSQMILHPRSGIFNLGSGVGISVQELIDKSLKITGQEGRSVICSKPSNQTSQLVLDISETVACFHWQPETDIDAVLQQMLKEKL